MKLLGISLGSLIVAALIWSTLYFWGQGFQYQAYEHPLMDAKTPLTALAANNLEEAKSFLTQNPDAVLSLNLYVSQDGQFFTAKAADLDFTKKGRKHYFYSFDELQKNSPNLTSLDTWVRALKPRFWIFDVQDNAPDVDKNLVTWLEKNNMQDKVIVTSPVDLVLTALKKERPLWVIGSSQSDMSKLLTLSSIGLEGIANFKRDYYFTPVSFMNREVLNSRVFDEMKKRFKKVAIGPVYTDQDREKALQFHPDILILDPVLANK